MRKTFAIYVVVLCAVSTMFAQAPGWPRTITKEGAHLVYYQPQIDNWKDFKQLDGRMALSLTPANGKQVIGVVAFQSQTTVDVDHHTVTLNSLKIAHSYFPSLDPDEAARMGQLLRNFLPANDSLTISLDRLVASVHKSKHVSPRVDADNNPPKIFVSYDPAILLQVEGKPVQTPIKKTKLQFVVNSNFPVFVDKPESKYYLFSGKNWLVASDLQGEWVATATLPKDMNKVTSNPNWSDLKSFIPPPAASAATAPKVFYTNSPAEVIAFRGKPVYAKIPDTSLVYATNTNSTVFVDSPTETFYYLTAGRWFSAPRLQGPWTYATPTLPADFAKIPLDSPAAHVLASVPGTPEAEDAVLLAQIPTTVEVDPATAAAKVKVTYYGKPNFEPLTGTSLHYAVNTPNRVIRVGNLYYVCFQGVWFMSPSPQGPWATAHSVPSVIYTIPPSSPVYNVTYVTQVPVSNGFIEASYTAGYLGTFVVGAPGGAVIISGTGYYYPPYIGYGFAPYPVYYPYAATYGALAWYSPYVGAYGVGHAVYSPYGAAGYRASYNPYTGTYARSATAYGPYGRRSAAQAYNPYTGAYAATRQGSDAYAQWGSSVVARGNESVATQHYSTARGTVGSAQTAAGGKAVGATTAHGSALAEKTAGGDMYADRNGNVYRNTGGGWQKYNDGSWNNVDKTAGSSFKHAEANPDFQGLRQDFQNRQRGELSSQRFQDLQSHWGGRLGGGSGDFRGRR